MSTPTIQVEFVYALRERQVSRRIVLPEGSTIEEAVEASGFAREFPEIDPTRVGVFGKCVLAGSKLRDGDRVEFYRTLRADPKEIRRRRARR